MKRDRQERLINKIDQKRIIRLQEQLENSAFRHGTSAFRYGLIPQAPSDHLPITAQVTPTTAPSLNLMSWNLLADSHLYNNFMNISGSSLLADAIAESGEENLYFSSERNMLYHFFSELAQFLYKNKTDGNIVITGDHLKQFIELKTSLAD